jgi:RNA polymerase sigma-70 factor (ECF subfamily)
LGEDAEPRVDALGSSVEHFDPQQQLLRDEVARRVHQTVSELPIRYAQALTWKYSDGLPVTEIALRLGVSAKAAESLLTRAREAFRAHFSTNGGARASSSGRHGH